MTSFGLYTINLGRPQILKLWCSMIKRLRNDLQIYFPAVVVSGQEDKDTCERYHVHHITRPNDPVSEKWNVALNYLRGQNVEYATILGSDDNISSGFLRSQIEAMETKPDLIGINSFYFYAGDGKFRGQMVRLTSTHILGIAKTISSRVLDQCDWRPWNVMRKWGMDAIASKTIAPYVQTKVIIEGIVTDVKTRCNLNSFNIWGKRLPQVPAKVFYDTLSEEELLILNNL